MENISARFGRLASSVWCWVPYKEYGMPSPQQQKWQRPTERDIIPGLKLLDHADMDAPGSVNFKIAWRSWLSKCLSKKLFARSCPVLVKVVSFPIMAFFKFWFWLDPPTTFRLEYRFKKYAFYGRPLMDGNPLSLFIFIYAITPAAPNTSRNPTMRTQKNQFFSCSCSKNILLKAEKNVCFPHVGCSRRLWEHYQFGKALPEQAMSMQS